MTKKQEFVDEHLSTFNNDGEWVRDSKAKEDLNALIKDATYQGYIKGRVTLNGSIEEFEDWYKQQNQK